MMYVQIAIVVVLALCFGSMALLSIVIVQEVRRIRRDRKWRWPLRRI